MIGCERSVYGFGLCENHWQRERKYRLRRAQHSYFDGLTECEACGSSANLRFDHDHATGDMRGVLCNRCNTLLGFAQDDAVRLRALADYLQRDRAG